MSLAAALVARGRVAAENKLMIDACVVRRRTGSSTGPGGVVTSTWSTVYTGKCRLKVESQTQGQMSDIGEAARVVTRRTLQVPVAAVGLLEADQVTIAASALDPDLVGNVYTVRVVPEGTTLTRRDVVLVEVTS